MMVIKPFNEVLKKYEKWFLKMCGNPVHGISWQMIPLTITCAKPFQQKQTNKEEQVESAMQPVLSFVGFNKPVVSPGLFWPTWLFLNCCSRHRRRAVSMTRGNRVQPFGQPPSGLAEIDRSNPPPGRFLGRATWSRWATYPAA